MESPIAGTHVHLMMHVHTVLFWFIIGEDVGALAERMVATAVFMVVVDDGGGERRSVG